MKTRAQWHRRLRRIVARLLAGWPCVTQAQLAYYESAELNLELPDGGGLGTFVQHTCSGIERQIAYVTVTLKISGTWSDDLYAYVNMGGTYAVLLNRVGKTATNPVGYGDYGFDVRLYDEAINGDIHEYRVTYGGSPPLSPIGALIGDWAPGGRASDPDVALGTDSRPSMLSGFTGKNPNRKWTWFVADLAPGSVHRLEGWGLRSHMVPEPEAFGWLLGGAAILWLSGVRMPSPRHAKTDRTRPSIAHVDAPR